MYLKIMYFPMIDSNLQGLLKKITKQGALIVKK